jgi:L-fucose mutarotase/ribose pyranase (RbsD/FucU family)
VNFDAIDRNEFYQRLPEATAVVHTLSDEPYANLLLTVNPSASESLRKIPDVVCIELAEVLSRAGHSQAVVIVPSSHRHLFELAPRALKLTYSCSPSQIAQAISHLWLPDTHVQNPKLPLQRPLGILCEDTLSAEKGIAALEGRWSDQSLMQILNLNAFTTELTDRRVVVCIEAEGHDSTPGVCYIMKNWISGHNGGF